MGNHHHAAGHHPPHRSLLNEQPRLVIFPGEGVNAKGITVGHIYVINGCGEAYEMAGGPAPGVKRASEGGHTADSTPTGHFVLDHAEHVTTSSWPMSIIPWGSPLREHDGVFQYQVAGHWHTASGPRGAVTLAAYRFLARSNVSMSLAKIDEKYVRPAFYEADGTVSDRWRHNDFGKWGWNLKKNGHRTAYFIHTTPPDEVSPTNIPLGESHGCIHIHPLDRDEMIGRGYLKAGTQVEITAYGLHGPPKK